MMKNLLYIGINGFAGSGKDSVAKMLKVILGQQWDNMDDCWTYFNTVFNRIDIPATYNKYNNEKGPVYLIAYADQLKNICSAIFGIPVDRFYGNKETAWLCVNHDFKYTESKPNNIITAEDYYFSNKDIRNSEDDYYMSLREILVYVGTYVLQEMISKKVFINVVENKISQELASNKGLRYVICTDVRFEHEIEHIRKNNGITIKIVRDDVVQLDNVAEHTLDDEESYNYIIYNNGTYEDLFKQVWDMVHHYAEFSNTCARLISRENVNNYLRLMDSDDKYDIWKICPERPIRGINKNAGNITGIDLSGGPSIYTGEPLTIITNNNVETDIKVYNIMFAEADMSYYIIVKKM